MATLNTKSTDGRLSFQKYVTDNTRFRDIDFEIEKGITATVYIAEGKAFSITNKKLRPGTKFKIISKKLVDPSGMKLAETNKGLISINSIRKPTGGNGTQYEDEAVDGINAYIKKSGGMIDVKLQGSQRIYKNIRYAIKVDAAIKSKAGVRDDPKADIIMCQDKNNPISPNSIFISHKKAGGPEAFRQYGGLSEKAGILINTHPLVQAFLGEVAKLLGEKTSLPNPIMATFKNIKLSNMSIYGPDYGAKFSLQHTQLIGQGKPVFVDKSNYVELSFSGPMGLSGNLSHFRGRYEPVFGAIFSAARGFNYKGRRYTGARVAIYPKQFMANRSGLISLSL